jgi:hypothetical protein
MRCLQLLLIAMSLGSANHCGSIFGSLLHCWNRAKPNSLLTKVFTNGFIAFCKAFAHRYPHFARVTLQYSKKVANGYDEF